MSPFFIKYAVKVSHGVKMPRLNKSNFKAAYLPIPPLEEQKRIVAKLEKLMPLVEDYGKAYDALEELNGSIPSKLKQSILQYAMEGKLVPQNKDDGCASKQIKSINPNANYIALENSELFNDLPTSWSIVKLNEICSKIVDGDHNPPKGEEYATNYIMLSATNINNGTLNTKTNVRYLSQANFELAHKRTNCIAGDILLTIVGSLGRTCILEEISENITFQRSVACLRTGIYNKYLKYYLDSPLIQQYIDQNARATAQKGFYLKQLRALEVAVPPLEEQKRIVAKIEALFEQIDRMQG